VRRGGRTRVGRRPGPGGVGARSAHAPIVSRLLRTAGGTYRVAGTRSVPGAQTFEDLPHLVVGTQTCNETSWQQYKPHKTFPWGKTSGWFYINDVVHVRFRSSGGEYSWKNNSNCKRVQTWKASGTEYQTLAKGLEPLPHAGAWAPTNEFCGKNNQMNVIVACYRDATKTWRP
jgi:hypothetical protein